VNVSFISRAYHATKLAAKANGPTLMVVGGVVSMTAGAVIGAKKTLELEEVLEPHVDTLEKIDRTSGTVPSYDDKAAYRDKAKVTTRVVLDCGKLYAVPAVLFVGGAAMVFGGHRMMLQRNATLAIGFTALQKAFDSYRANVAQQFGSDADQAMLNGWKKQEVFNDKTGEVEQINVRDWDADEADPYNRVFEQGESTEWRPDLGMNKMFVAQMQRKAQTILGHRDVLYLSEVYESLGFDETPLSRVVGWKVRKNPDGSKDIPIVDFGLDKRHPDDWKYGPDHAIYLDFNCQGLIVGGKVQKILEQA
jgi:hypothetical protein